MDARARQDLDPPSRNDGRPIGNSGAPVFEPERGSGDCWPAFHEGSSTCDPFVQIRRRVPASLVESGFVVEWEHSDEAERVRDVFDWISGRPQDCTLWARMARLFGPDAPSTTILVEAEREAEARAVAEEEARLAEERLQRQRLQIELFILDETGARPGLSLKSEDMKKPFWVMRLSERWERERILDWLRWQRGLFLEFRDLVESEGPIALERLVIAGMLEKEKDMKSRKLASGGRRPLRLWRGE